MGNDNNPHFELEDGIAKEKNYKNLLKTTNVLDKTNSRFFSIPVGDNSKFDTLGFEEDVKIAKYEIQMLNKLNSIAQHISNEVPEEYAAEDLVVNINVNRQ